jgi:hypothetical protein
LQAFNISASTRILAEVIRAVTDPRVSGGNAIPNHH